MIQSKKDNVTYICLDTNTWIYLANGTEPVRLLRFIVEKLELGMIKVLVPEVVITEWEKNKDHAVKEGAVKHFKGVTESLDRILKLLGAKGERHAISFLLGNAKDNRDHFSDLIDKFKQTRKEVEDAIAENIKMVDDLFQNSKIEIIKTKTETTLKAAEFAIEKKAPFQKKNSFADALILFSFLDYVLANKIRGAIFISYNTDDFCERKDSAKFLHPHLKPEFSKSKSEFSHTVGEVLMKIDEAILTDLELQSIRDLQDESEPDECLHCADEGRYSPIYFSDADLLDERRHPRVDPNQVKIEFSPDARRKKSYDFTELIPTANCDYCGTDHFMCVRCRAINAIYDVEYEKRKECSFCELPYLIERSYDRKGAFEGNTYMVLRENMYCADCMKEFDSTDPDQEYCSECEAKRLADFS